MTIRKQVPRISKLKIQVILIIMWIRNKGHLFKKVKSNWKRLNQYTQFSILCVYFSWSAYSWADSRDRLAALFDYSSVYLILSGMDFDTHSINISIFIDIISIAINNFSTCHIQVYHYNQQHQGFFFLYDALEIDYWPKEPQWPHGVEITEEKKMLPCQ